ncbi:MAG: ribosome silencing factor [Clostridia bacterium]|nr:ribosome silencing factor [Clostridia bacterium]
MIQKVDLTKYDLNDGKDLAEAIAYLLDLKRGKSIVIIDVTEKTPEMDYFVITSANSQNGVTALANFVEDELSKCGIEPIHRDREGKWSALDYGSVIMHVFYSELRTHYQLERLWGDGPNVKQYGTED